MCVDDFQLTAATSLLKLVMQLTDATVDSQSRDTESRDTAPVTSVFHVDDALTEPPPAADDVTMNDELQPADDDVTSDDINDDDVIADAEYCFEDDVVDDTPDCDDRDYMPVYKTSVEKGMTMPNFTLIGITCRPCGARTYFWTTEYKQYRYGCARRRPAGKKLM